MIETSETKRKRQTDTHTHTHLYFDSTEKKYIKITLIK